MMPDDLSRTLLSLPFDKLLADRVRHVIGSRARQPSRVGVFRAHGHRPGRAHRLPDARDALQTPARRRRYRECAQSGASAIDTAPLLASGSELWVTPPANVLLGEPHSLLEAFFGLTTLVLGFAVVPTAAPPTVPGHAYRHQEPLCALEVRNDDPVVLCPKLHTICVYITAEEHVMQPYVTILSRAGAGHPLRRLVVGFYRPPEHAVLELATGLAGLIEEYTMLRPTDRFPEDSLWVVRLPFVSRDSSERNLHWPAWSRYYVRVRLYMFHSSATFSYSG